MTNCCFCNKPIHGIVVGCVHIGFACYACYLRRNQLLREIERAKT